MSTTAAPARHRRTSTPETPLGSLTQRGARGAATCRLCHSPRVTRIVIDLEDGPPVTFTSCLSCEHRTWDSAGELLSVDTVLRRAQR